jgi:putative ABC transport system substrate-binding protein
MMHKMALVMVAFALAAIADRAQAQQAKPVFRVGFLTVGSSPRSNPNFGAFVQGLRDVGYVEGQNLVIEFRKADGEADRLPGLAAELVRLPVDVLVAGGPEAVLRTASQATRTIPIVTMAVNYDPVAKGYIDSLARPGGNISGVHFMQLALSTKRVELLKKALPQVSRVFVLYDAFSADQLPPTEAAAQSLGLPLQSLELRAPPYDFDRAIAAALQARAEALVVLSSPQFSSQRRELIAQTLTHRLPAMFLFSSYVEQGGLMSYGANLRALYRHAATYVDKILKGANPAELAMEQPTTFELVINLKTAKQLGVTFPPIVLYQADKVIR